MKLKNLIFSYNNIREKYYSYHRLFSPFAHILHGLLELVLLPTKYDSELINFHLRTMVKHQMRKRTKDYNKNKL